MKTKRISEGYTVEFVDGGDEVDLGTNRAVMVYAISSADGETVGIENTDGDELVEIDLDDGETGVIDFTAGHLQDETFEVVISDDTEVDCVVVLGDNRYKPVEQDVDVEVMILDRI